MAATPAEHLPLVEIKGLGIAPGPFFRAFVLATIRKKGNPP